MRRSLHGNGGVRMRGTGEASGSQFSRVGPQARLPRGIRFARTGSQGPAGGQRGTGQPQPRVRGVGFGRPSIPPKRLIRASL